MKQLIKKFAPFVAAFAFVAAALFVPVVEVNATPATANKSECVTSGVQGGINCAKGDSVPSTLFGEGSIFTTVVNVLLFIIGALSVVMLIWGGIRYTTSAGNSSAVTSAKNTIMYAVIGLIVAFLAFAIVNWVLASLGKAS